MQVRGVKGEPEVAHWYGQPETECRKAGEEASGASPTWATFKISLLQEIQKLSLTRRAARFNLESCFLETKITSPRPGGTFWVRVPSRSIPKCPTKTYNSDRFPVLEKNPKTNNLSTGFFWLYKSKLCTQQCLTEGLPAPLSMCVSRQEY